MNKINLLINNFKIKSKNLAWYKNNISYLR